MTCMICIAEGSSIFILYRAIPVTSVVGYVRKKGNPYAGRKTCERVLKSTGIRIN